MHDLMEKHKIMCILFLIIVVGITCDVAAHLQRPCTATVTAVTDRTYTPSKNRGRSRHSARYRATLTVVYTDKDGAQQTGTFRYTTLHPMGIPKEGDDFPVVRGLLGVTAYPDNTLRSIGIALYGVPSFFFIMGLLVNWSLWRDRKRESMNE